MKIGDWAKSFKSVWGAGVLVATAGPLGLLVPDMDPPWPEHSYAIGVIFAAVAAIVSFTAGLTYAHQPRALRKFQTAFSLACLALGLMCLVWYFSAYSTRVVVETQMVGSEQHQLRFVVGTEMRTDVDKTQDADYLELLRDNQYSPERVWTSESLRYSRFLLLVTFVTAFFLLTLGMGLLATRPGSSSRAASRNTRIQSPQHRQS
jgi:hypothetical protein